MSRILIDRQEGKPIPSVVGEIPFGTVFWCDRDFRHTADSPLGRIQHLYVAGTSKVDTGVSGQVLSGTVQLTILSDDMMAGTVAVGAGLSVPGYEPVDLHITTTPVRP